MESKPPHNETIKKTVFKCRNCESSDSNLIYEQVPDRFHKMEGKFNYVRCEECGLLQLEMTPHNIEEYYADYRLHESESFLYRLFRGLLVRSYPLQKKFGEGRLLDVGCGNGWFIKSMSKKGWIASGYEPDSAYALMLGEKLDLKIFSSDELEAGFNNYFDLVTFNYSLEHTEDPVAALKMAYRSLRQGGMLSISVPNGEGLEARLFKDKWFHLDPPRHICIFSKELLGSIVEGIGFSSMSVMNEQIPTGFAGSISYMTAGSFIPAVWYMGMLPGIVFSQLVRDGNYTIQAKKKYS